MTEKAPMQDDSVAHAEMKEENISAKQDASVTAAEEVGLLDRITELETALATAETKAKNHWEMVLRAKAESENARRRFEREAIQARQFALEKFSRELLDVVDTLERALETQGEGEAFTTMHQGVELTLKMLSDRLEKFNVKSIDPVGEVFDPELHEAMSMIEDPQAAPNSIVAVMQKGYLLNERLLRPARVIVAKAQPEKKVDESA
ncbi:HSP-70 cofactor [Piscirickettsia salmonis]|uniref:nucleotide exchange factor GrpE n=1 Tax=Piscirickettsia salmonis TaxID=1238 RepID=UPI0012BA5A14|nr:nucleotide exchange factor GrpE [Piscirickettsia salmonis]QGP53007.1 HSP-70 cofactor [Piscirickettsia salmonis]QGP61062.1 HSP-70 cofactor [Piscirickettsia salmonis]QGP62579.1 HSP-70 cofactor [Piscirickettsia salmonis]